MTTCTVRWLSRYDVLAAALPLASALNVVEATLREHGNGAFENPPKIGVHPQTDAFIHAMAGWLPMQKRGGVKWVAGYSRNFKRGLPNITGLMILNDPETGLPICVMDASYITAIRTSAASAITSKYLAPNNVDRIAVIGAGLQGLYHVKLMSLIHPLAEFQVVDINPGAVDHLAKQVSAEARVVHVREAESAIRAADVVVTATSRLEEVVFKFGWTKKASLVLPIHFRGWSQDITTASDALFTDDVGQFTNFMSATGSPYKDLSRLRGSVSSVVVGNLTGRSRNSERIAVFNLGLAIHDVAIAAEILSLAERQNIGTVVDY
ncbi:ornithine cyclodeaminase family protein [Methylobacterium sp. WSM2598]|uniref:ornithine cyclodeaminase family protein n=1 Tax=Methylobacterium sp. WSM2598 TaxID=398261 RepID=UPI0009FC62F8|nr:ornithine cyclodeaminase family protein [Methylobacterium sp. WSM2598]